MFSLLMYLIIACLCFQLSKLSWLRFFWASVLSVYTTFYYIYVSKRDNWCYLLGVLLCSSHIWMSRNIVLLALSPARERFALGSTLQYQAISQWCSNLWGLLYLGHLALYALHAKMICFYFQQFLYWGTPRFMFVPLMVAMYQPTLMHLLMTDLALVPLWESHISIYIIAISDLGEVLITLEHTARVMSLSITLCNKISSTWVTEMELDELYTKDFQEWFGLGKTRDQVVIAIDVF